MRRLASIVALLLLLSTAAPILACMTSSAMTHEENACCLAMHGNCGKMARMGCCRTEVRADEHPQFVTVAPSVNTHWAVVHWLTAAAAGSRILPVSVFHAPQQHSPPGLITAQITVLRI